MITRARIVFQPGNPATVLASKNVVGVTRDGAGHYNIEVTELWPIPDVNFCCLTGLGGFTGVAADLLHLDVRSLADGSLPGPGIKVRVFDATGNLTDDFSEASIVVVADSNVVPSE